MITSNIIKFKSLENIRLDPEFYKKEYALIYKNLSKFNLKKLGELCFVTDGQHGYFKVDNKSEIRQIVGENIFSDYNVLDKTSATRLDKLTHEKNLRSNLEVNDLVLSTVGTIGKVGVVSKEILPANINQSVCRIKVEETSLLHPLFLSIFLKSKYGQLQIQKYSTGQVQIGFYLHKVRDLLIPMIESPKQKPIINLAKESLEKYKESVKLYCDAEKILLKEIGFENYRPKENMFFTSKFSNTIKDNRIDADYFQPIYDKILNKIRDYSKGFMKIEDLFTQNKERISKKKEYYNYIEIGDINPSTGRVDYMKRHISEIPDNGKLKLKNGDLLISKVRPYRGAVSFIDFNEDNLLGSIAFTVLRENGKYNKEVLMVFLRTGLIKDLLLKYNCGTSYPVIKDKDILNLIIPLIPKKIQNNISEKIKNSFVLKEESIKILNKAIKEVEDLIESK